MRHGIPQAYREGCKCPVCRKAWALYAAETKRRRLAGDPLMVPAGEVRDHVRFLFANGLSVNAIARHASLTAQAVNKIRHGQTRRTHVEVASALLAVTLEEDRAFVPVERARRIVRALQREGCRKSDIAAWLGQKGRNLNFMYAPYKWVKYRTLRKLIVLATMLVRERMVPASVLKEVTK